MALFYALVLLLLTKFVPMAALEGSASICLNSDAKLATNLMKICPK